MLENTDLKVGEKYGDWTIIEDTGEVTRWGEKIYKAMFGNRIEMIVWQSHIQYGGPGHPVSELNGRKRAKKETGNRTRRKSPP